MGTGAYHTIVVDPPWPYGAWGTASDRPNQHHARPLPYRTMAIADIAALPVRSLGAAACELYLWTTQRYLPQAFGVLSAWGFRYCQTLVWAKAPRGRGQGGVYTPTTEFVLLGRVGHMPTVRRIDSTWFNWKRPHNHHSAKPEAFYDLIETVTEAPRLEMFARRQRLGWDVWGDEVQSSVALGA